MATFEITIRKNGEFQSNLKAEHGRGILISEVYARKQPAWLEWNLFGKMRKMRVRRIKHLRIELGTEHLLEALHLFALCGFVFWLGDGLALGWPAQNLSARWFRGGAVSVQGHHAARVGHRRSIRARPLGHACQ